MAMVVMATLQQCKCDRQQFAATSLVHPPLNTVYSQDPGWYVWLFPHLSPQQLSHTDEDTPQPLVDGQGCAGEWLPSKLNNDDLRRKRNIQHILAV